MGWVDGVVYELHGKEWIVSILEMCIKSTSHPTVGVGLHLLYPQLIIMFVVEEIRPLRGTEVRPEPVHHFV